MQNCFRVHNNYHEIPLNYRHIYKNAQCHIWNRKHILWYMKATVNKMPVTGNIYWLLQQIFIAMLLCVWTVLGSGDAASSKTDHSRVLMELPFWPHWVNRSNGISKRDKLNPLAALTKSPTSDSAEGDREAILHGHSQSLLEWQSLCLKSIISAEGPWCRGSQDSSHSLSQWCPDLGPHRNTTQKARAGSNSRGSVKPCFSRGDPGCCWGLHEKRSVLWLSQWWGRASPLPQICS